MRTAWLAIVLTSLAAVVRAAEPYSEPYSGAHLLSLCKSPEGGPRCEAYIEGVRSGLRAQRLSLAYGFKKSGTKPPEAIAALLTAEPFCIPSGVSSAKLANELVVFLEGSGVEHATDSGAFAIVYALSAAYPCTN